MSLTKAQCATVEAVLEAHLGRCVKSFLAAVNAPDSGRYARITPGDPLHQLERDLNDAADAAARAAYKLGDFATPAAHDLRKALRTVIHKTVNLASLAQILEPANG